MARGRWRIWISALVVVGACSPNPLPTTDGAANAGGGDSSIAADLSIVADANLVDLVQGADLTGVCLPATTLGASIRVPCISRLDFHYVGGLLPPPPPGSTCAGAFTATVDTASRLLSWDKCLLPADFLKNPWMRQMGSRILLAGELDGLLMALDRVTVAVSTYDYCDQPQMTIGVTTPQGALIYADSTYGCGVKPPPGGNYLRDIDVAFIAIERLCNP